MPTTSNFGWTTPADTDLVKDGAAAIRTLGNGIDTSLVDLKGGTTGQILSKASNTDLDYTWITNDVGDITAVTAGTGISGGGTSGSVTITNSMATEITAAGDIIVGTGSATFDNLPIGTTGQVLTADTTVSPYKVKWAAAGGGDFVKITSGSFSGVSEVNIDSCFTSTYNNYFAYVNFTGDTSTATLEFRFRVGSTSQSSAAYYGSGFAYPRGNTVSTFGTTGGTESQITGEIGASSNSFNNVNMYFEGVGISGTDLAHTWGQTRFGNTQSTGLYSAVYGPGTNNVNYNGFSLFPSSGTITGNYVVYGLVK